LFKIAQEQYGDPNLWPFIVYKTWTNTELAKNPPISDRGRYLNIPDLDGILTKSGALAMPSLASTTKTWPLRKPLSRPLSRPQEAARAADLQRQQEAEQEAAQAAFDAQWPQARELNKKYPGTIDIDFSGATIVADGRSRARQIADGYVLWRMGKIGGSPLAPTIDYLERDPKCTRRRCASWTSSN